MARDRSPAHAVLTALVLIAAGCAGTAQSPLLAKIEDVQDAAALVASESRYAADRDSLPLAQACGVARGAILEGRLREAIECAIRTFYLGQRDKNAAFTAEGARLLAEAYGFAGKLDLSNRFAKLALGEAVTLPEGSEARNATEAVAWRVLGENLSRQGRYADALGVFKRAEALPAVSTFSRETLGLAIANTHLRGGNLAGARETFRRFASREDVPPRLRVQALRGLGDVFAAEDRPSDATAQYQAALTLARRSRDLPEVAWILERLGRTLLRKDDRRAAIERWQAAVDVVESLRAEFRSEEFRTAFFGNHADLYDQLVGVLAAEGRAGDAFAMSERSRARALRDMMAHRTKVLDVSAARQVRETEEARQELALLRVDQRFGTGDGASGPPRMAELEARLREIAARPSSGDASVDLILRSASGARTAPDVQARLPAGTALLQYHVLETETVLWRLDRDRVRLYRLGVGRAGLRTLVEDFRQSVVGRQIDTIERSRALYRLLVAPALADVPVQALIVVPHDVLHFLPFGALAEGNRFLLETAILNVVPSASALDQRGRGRPRPSAQLAAFGNPLTDSQYRLPPLPGAEAEARAIGEAFPGAKVFTGSQASKTIFLAEAQRQHIVHVAAHALFDDVDPMASAVFLAPDGRRPGRLQAQEMFALRLDSTRLVVLSACQTGLGRVGRGDEVVGLSRALLAAGVRSLVLSLWEVDDASTAQLMMGFYRELKDRPVAESMRRAQLDVMKTHREPFFWASFFAVDLLEP